MALRRWRQKRGAKKSDRGECREVTPPPIIDKVLASPGQPLDAATRAFFEPRFGHDFGKVRVHAGRAAAQSAQEMSARAFTIGNNIVFGSGQLAPETQDGRRLLAHELTHVLQRRTGNVSRQIIQRAKIPYGPLSWADFKAQPPANRNPAEGAGFLSAFDIPGIAVSPDTRRAKKVQDREHPFGDLRGKTRR